VQLKQFVNLLLVHIATTIVYKLMSTGNDYGNDYGSQANEIMKGRKPSKWLRKTKLCVYHLQNNCSLGTGCLFAHSLNELQDGPDLYKTQICRNFQNGMCNNPDCTFAHSQEELQPFPTLKLKLCKWHRKGRCRNGESCSFAHGRQDLRSDNDAGIDTLEDASSIAPAAMQTSLQAAQLAQQAPSTQGKPVTYLNLQAAVVPGPTHAPPESVYPSDNGQSRTPLNQRATPFVPMSTCSQVAPVYVQTVQGGSPYVPLSACVMVPSPCTQDQFFDDSMSTSAETAGYLSD
jgi:hypothetical protein